MQIRQLHSWKVTPAEAIAIQKELAPQVITQNSSKKITYIAGADLSLTDTHGIAGVILYSYPDLEEVERVSARVRLTFPYVSGLLSFREAPVLIEAFKKLRTEPDIIIFDGQGIAHPRGLGLASHMGLILERPTIGCAKSLLVGEYEEPAKEFGSTSPLIYKDKNVGSVLRSRANVKPIFISVGHQIGLKSALQVILNCCTGVRIPKPTREADHFVGELKKYTVRVIN